MCIQGAVYEAVPGRLPFDYESLGKQELKGISKPVRAYAVSLKSGENIPPPEVHTVLDEAPPEQPKRRWIVVEALALLVIIGGVLAWFQLWAPREEWRPHWHFDFRHDYLPGFALQPTTFSRR